MLYVLLKTFNIICKNKCTKRNIILQFLENLRRNIIEPILPIYDPKIISLYYLAMNKKYLFVIYEPFQ